MNRRRARRRRATATVAAAAVVVALGFWLAPRSTGPARLASTGDGSGEAQPSMYRTVSSRLLSGPSVLPELTVMGEVVLTRGEAGVSPVFIVMDELPSRITSVTLGPWRASTGEGSQAVGNEQCPGNQQFLCDSTTVTVDLASRALPLYVDNELLPDGRTVVEADVTVTDTSYEVRTEAIRVEIVATETDVPPTHVSVTTF